MNNTLDPITYYGKNILVSAGAGCGKTYTLTKRVLNFIKNEGFKLEDFLILTFTNLAAGEMKNRIREELSKDANPSVKNEANNVDFADIMTFDAFALSLVKKYHFYLGIGNNVKNIDESVIKIKKTEILNDLFEEKYKNNDPDFTSLIRKYCFKKDDDIVKLVLDIHAKAVLSGDINNYLDTFEKRYFEDNLDNLYTGLKEYFRLNAIEIIDKFRYLPEIRYGYGRKTKKYDILNECRKCFYEEYKPIIEIVDKTGKLSDEEFKNLINLLSVAKKVGTCKDENGVKIKIKENPDSTIGEIKEDIKNLPLTKDELKEYLDKYTPYIKVLVDLVKELEVKISEFKKNLNAYEFGDIAHMAYDLLKDDNIRNSIKNKYKMIMVDEYQDTSKLQDDFVMKIANDNLFMVGDVKQSIYRFREARCDLFIDKYNSYSKGEGGVLINLNKSYRTKRSAINDINKIFNVLMTKDQGGCDYKNEHNFSFGNTAYDMVDPNDHKLNSNIELLVYDESHKQAIDQARIVAIDISNKIKNKYLVMDKKTKKARPCRYDDFSIILDRGGDFDTYAKEFTDLKLPIYVENDEKIEENSISLVLTNILRIVRYKLNALNQIQKEDNPFPKKAIISVARSFIFSYNDQEILDMCNGNLLEDKAYKTIDEIVYANRYLPLSRLFRALIDELHVYESLNSLGNVEKNNRILDFYLDRVNEMEALGYGIDSFIDYMENIKDAGTNLKLSPIGNNVNSVKIINIHKSKGLENTIIYYPGLTKGFNERDITASINISNKVGLILPADNPNDFNVLKAIHEYYEKVEESAERLRQLYVALTRVREKIILVCPERDKEYIDSKYENIIYFKKCMFDYLKPILLKWNLPEVKYDLDKDLDALKQNQASDVANKKNLALHDEVLKNIEGEKITIHRPSKELDLTAKKTNLEFGNKLHMYMELCDLKNVDLASIKDPLEKKTIEGFLKSDLAKDIRNGSIYKEYEFYHNDIHGIIDLMIVYNDHIDIIDYKTNDIDEKEYDVQLNTYMAFAEDRFNLPAKGYLYSLQRHVYREVLKIS